MAFDPQAADLSLAASFAAWAMNDELLRRLAADGFADTRVADGVLIQHVVDGPRTITDLARRMAVTQQAASKQVADLERRNLVRRARDPADGRARPVELSDRGWRAVEAGRSARAEVAGEVAMALGAEDTRALVALLTRLSAATGAARRLLSRTLRPEAER
jgi:DNA-binding MarR family transcriptional regulator